MVDEADGNGHPRRMAWLITGAEGYGLAGTISEVGRRLMARGTQPIAFALHSGSFATQLREDGWITVVLSHEGIAHELRKTPRNRRHALVRSLRTRNATRALASKLRKHFISALVTRSGALLPLLGSACKAADVRPWWYMAGALPHGISRVGSRLYYRTLLKLYGIRVIANSRYTRQSLFGSVALGPVIYTPIALKALDSARRQVAWPPGLSKISARTKFLICARLVSWKGHLEFINAFLRVKQEGHDVALVIAGDGDRTYTQLLANLIESSPAGIAITMLGKRTDVPALMIWSDIIVSPSIAPEPFGRVCIEAQAVGRPVLATALGGPTETVLDGETGWLIPEPTVEAMAAGIRRALADRGKWSSMGTRAMERVRREYCSEVLADRLVDLVLQENS